MDPDARCRIGVEGPFDLHRTLGRFRHGIHDPTLALSADSVWRATLTNDGPATLRLHHSAGHVDLEAWGPGASRAVASAPALLGLHDRSRRLDGPHEVVRALSRRFEGVHIGRTGNVAEALLPAVCEQKVTGVEAARVYARLVRQFGQVAPGPVPLMVPPAPEVLAAAPSWSFHRAGLERRRATTISAAMDHPARLAECLDLPSTEAQRVLRSFPGIGSWTAAEVASRALGDPDAVPLGDFHLPNTVSWALAGEPRGTDERMLELLEPYAGQRGRVLLLLASGGVQAPRWGPRMAPGDIRRF